MTNTLNLPQCLLLRQFISGSENILCNMAFTETIITNYLNKITNYLTKHHLIYIFSKNKHKVI
jgi:hypothetical protein